MNELVILAVVGMFGLMGWVVLIYRQDAIKRTEQATQWSVAQEQVLKVLESTEKLLTEQQAANKSLEKLNADLTKRMAAMQVEIETVRSELKIVRQQLEAMTARAEKAEDKAGE